MEHLKRKKCKVCGIFGFCDDKDICVDCEMETVGECEGCGSFTTCDSRGLCPTCAEDIVENDIWTPYDADDDD